MLRSRNAAFLACFLVLAFTAGGPDLASGQDRSAARKPGTPNPTAGKRVRPQARQEAPPDEGAPPEVKTPAPDNGGIDEPRPPILNLPAPETIKPTPLAEIPDNPPPHESALLDVPHIIEPPDILGIEVMMALPGRPITGEYLVRSDGTVNLGWYGDVHLRGLTLEQAKTKLMLHLRTYLTDVTLGLYAPDPVNGELVAVPPSKTDKLYVDVMEYNSAYYYVLGDVALLSKLNITGSETVLDAIQHSGGLLPSADDTNITLVRPSREGKPARTYKIDYAAIKNGNSKANLQIFKNDRLIVGRKTIGMAPNKPERLGIKSLKPFELSHSAKPVENTLKVSVVD